MLLDIVIPDEMGIDAIDPIKKTHPPATIIMVSANDDDELVEECLKKGAEDFIVKPFKASSIIHKIKEIINR